MRLALTRLLCRSTPCYLARRSYPVVKNQKVHAADNMPEIPVLVAERSEMAHDPAFPARGVRT